MYLAAAGVGHLTLVDDDIVELSNLQRQIVHSTADLRRPKVESARDRLLALNPTIEVDAIATRLDDDDFSRILPDVDAVVDATDNFATRFMINRHCVRHNKTLISGAAIRFEGQVSVFHAGSPDSPCYRCLYTSETALAETCTQTGVVAPLLGIIGSVQAMETMKVLMGIGQDLRGRLLLLDALSMEWQSMRFNKRVGCPECGQAEVGT
jgi:molybdopterin/thiamine biosynthesis adenylyltransferase